MLTGIACERRIGLSRGVGPVSTIGGTLDTERAAVGDVGVDPGRCDVAVAEQLLDGPDVVARFEGMRRNASRTRASTNESSQACLYAGSAHGALERLLRHGLGRCWRRRCPVRRST